MVFPPLSAPLSQMPLLLSSRLLLTMLSVTVALSSVPSSALFASTIPPFGSVTFDGCVGCLGSNGSEIVILLS